MVTINSKICSSQTLLGRVHITRALYFSIICQEHCHPSQTKLEIECRVVQFSARLPHPSANRMSWTTLHPIFTYCPAKLRWFAVHELHWTRHNGRIRRSVGGIGHAIQITFHVVSQGAWTNRNSKARLWVGHMPLTRPELWWIFVFNELFCSSDLPMGGDALTCLLLNSQMLVSYQLPTSFNPRERLYVPLTLGYMQQPEHYIS